MEIGDKIKFDNEVQRYTVQAFDDRYIILTKPFNARRTYLYTIVDLKKGIRGACDLIFGLPEHCNTPEGAAECLKWLNGFEDEHGGGEMAVSRRNYRILSENETNAILAKYKGGK